MQGPTSTGRRDVIVLSAGISGSSVLTGLIASQGYWLGRATKKIDYETYENSELVDLNIRVLRASGFGWHDVLDLPPPSVERIREVSRAIDRGPFLRLLDSCDRHRPWLWKDPRLCYTIHFWQELVDLRSCTFVLMTRAIEQAWTGLVLRAGSQIPYREMARIHDNCVRASRRFLEEHSIDALALTFEDLILDPEGSLARLNEHLGLGLALDDLRRIYRGRLGHKRWSELDFFRARVRLAGRRIALGRRVRFPRAENRREA